MRWKENPEHPGRKELILSGSISGGYVEKSDVYHDYPFWGLSRSFVEDGLDGKGYEFPTEREAKQWVEGKAKSAIRRMVMSIRKIHPLF